ncbi:hypothetical protein DYH09_13175 [bacterium CPR1]|nr:hypothetical protein [bacterium CPR1]
MAYNTGTVKTCILFFLLGCLALAQPVPVPEADQTAARALLNELYAAYESRQVDRVMALIAPAVEASAQGDAQGRAQEIRDAFRAFHEDLLSHPDFRLEPFNDQFLGFEPLKDGSFRVISSVPIILSDSLVFKESDGTPTPPIRLRLGAFTMQRDKAGTLRITGMDL